MSIITIDFETFYSKDYTLKKLTTEEYIRDPRFEIIGVGIKLDNDQARFFTGTRAQIKTYLADFDWDHSCALCHNTAFDGAILEWILGVYPAFYLDTLSMARALHGSEVGGSLGRLSEFYGIGTKGDEVIHAVDKHLSDFTEQELASYGAYCVNDVELTYKLYNELRKEITNNSELEVIHTILCMFIRPELEVDVNLLTTRLADIKQEKASLLGSLRGVLGVKSDEEVRKVLSSNQKFAGLLEALNVQVPLKTSPTTGELIPAFAKTDIGFISLESHEDPLIQQLCSIRLNTKSTLEETRIQSFLQIAARNNNKLPIPLKFYGAHTGRPSAQDGINMLNLPSRDKNKNTLKKSLKAPPGYKLINADSSQIEVRVLAYISGEQWLLDAFAAGRSPYLEFGRDLYDREITKQDEVEYAVSKATVLGLGYGMGAERFEVDLNAKVPNHGLVSAQIKNIVNTYRRKSRAVTTFWRDCENVLARLTSWPEFEPWVYLGKNEVLRVLPFGINLPNGFYLNYRDLRLDGGQRVYTSPRYGTTKIYGSKVCENLCQALAWQVLTSQMLKVAERYRVLLTVYDSLLVMVPEQEIFEASEFVKITMSTPPEWAKNLPVTCEVKSGFNYGECS